eukprot:scaffold6193_cov139-Skeletonema_menzelii.AAC.1
MSSFNTALDRHLPLSEWIRPVQTLGNQQTSGGGGNDSAATALPDDYLIPALQIACSLANQICKAKEEIGKSPEPGSDWIDSIEVITDGEATSSFHADGDGVSSSIRVEILPSLLYNTTNDNNSGRARNGEILYSLGIVVYEIFSRGERPAELERKQTEVDGPDGCQGQASNEAERLLVERLDALPFDQDQGGGMIDLDRVEIDDFELIKFDDDLQDQYNDIWGNHDTDGSLQGRNSRKKGSASNDYVMCAVSVEPLKTRGVPGPLCDLIANMLDISEGIGGSLEGEDAYQDMSDVRDDLQLMLDKPSIYLYDQDMGRFSTTGLQFGGTLFGRKAELLTIIDSYRRSEVGESESVLISGKSGTGKSLLAVEVGKHVISNGGVLLTGKFDQLQQGKPFSALASAFNHFCDFVLCNRGLDLVRQKVAHQLDCVLGSDAYYLTKLIPKLTAILGLNISCGYHDENCVDAQKRLQWLLCEFVQVISTSFAAPVTLFLDDLQWADPASIAAVKHLLLAVNPTTQDAHFFFLGCYRKGETDGGAICDSIIPSINVKLDCMCEET